MVQQKEKFLPKVLFAVGAEIVVLPNVRTATRGSVLTVQVWTIEIDADRRRGGGAEARTDASSVHRVQIPLLQAWACTMHSAAQIAPIV